METFIQLDQIALWLVPLAGLIAFIESLAFAGIIVPGVALLFAVASAAGQQQTDIYLLLGAAYIGAVCGDLISFWLGRNAAPYVESHWPLKRHPEWISRGHLFFERYGSYSVVLGRFIGPIRPVIPFVAGTLAMPSRRFILLNLLSASVWAPVYILPGYILGNSAATLPSNWLAPIYLLIGLITLLLLFHKLHQWLQPEKALAARIQGFIHRCGLWPAKSAAPLPALTLLLFSSISLIVILLLRKLPPIAHWNSDTQNLIAELLSQQPVLAGITMLGDKPFLSLLLACSAGWLYWQKKQLSTALGLLLIALAGVLTNSALKLWFAAERPETGQWLNSYSFPSGHTSAAAICLGVMATTIALPLAPALRRACYMITLTLVCAVALSRVGLGVHWPLDVLAAMSLGGIVAAMFRIIADYLNWKEQLDSNNSVALLLLSLIISAGYIAFNWQDNLLLYGINA